MSFGQQDDEFLTISLNELLRYKESIKQHLFVPHIVPMLSNYELKAGFVFQLSVIPFAYDVSIGERYDNLQPNDYQLCDHLDIDTRTVNGTELLAFKSSDYKRVRNLIDTN